MIVAINKPVGPTSHDVVNQIRRITDERRVGHAGTLDPLASGVLVVGIGREATRQLGGIVKKEKEYVATVKLGEMSTTDDEEGEKTAKKVIAPPSPVAIQKVLLSYKGTIKQTPPAYSAIKTRGQTAYRLARAGHPPQLALRPVVIKKIELFEYHYPLMQIRVQTGPGVYIRALARDIGAALKTGGYLQALERTRVGQYTIDQSLTIEQFEKTWQASKR